MKYYTSVKISELNLHRSTWVNFMSSMLMESSKAKSCKSTDTDCWVSNMQNEMLGLKHVFLMFKE